MQLIKIADVPPTTVSPATTVLDAVHAMMQNRVGAVAVVDKERLAGIFTERDVMIKIVAPKRSPEATLISEVMTKGVESVTTNTTAPEALRLMLQRHIRHLPITDQEGKILGMLSIRNLLRHQNEYLARELKGLEAYLTADGVGG
ncbi:CBS domain-containing protein [candidate division KSB1 bacterium]|nr:CBS domain-containing protein [candidate division KSB1 bacterium]